MMQAVRTFFWTNRATCREWLSRVRLQLMLIAQSQHDFATIVRHGYILLSELTESTSSPVIIIVIMYSLSYIYLTEIVKLQPYVVSAIDATLYHRGPGIAGWWRQLEPGTVCHLCCSFSKR